MSIAHIKLGIISIVIKHEIAMVKQILSVGNTRLSARWSRRKPSPEAEASKSWKTKKMANTGEVLRVWWCHWMHMFLPKMCLHACTFCSYKEGIHRCKCKWTQIFAYKVSIFMDRLQNFRAFAKKSFFRLQTLFKKAFGIHSSYFAGWHPEEEKYRFLLIKIWKLKHSVFIVFFVDSGLGSTKERFFMVQYSRASHFRNKWSTFSVFINLGPSAFCSSWRSGNFIFPKIYFSALFREALNFFKI